MGPLIDSARLPRAHTRVGTDLSVEVYGSDGTSLLGIARLADLSEAGACLETTSDLNEGDALFLRGALSPQGMLRLRARVVWKRLCSKTQQYGVCFIDLTPEARSALRASVQDQKETMGPLRPPPA